MNGNEVVRIHRTKQPKRPHFIAEWAEFRKFKSQSEIADALNCDKSVVSHWFRGGTPSVEYQEKLAALFHCEGGPESLFRDPDDDWLTRFFKGRSAEERERIKATLEMAFPRKKAS